MKRMMIAGALALVAGSQALAADLPPMAAPPRAPATYVPVAAPIYNWSGIYVGINGGWGFGTSNWTTSATTTTTSSDFDLNGGLVGGTLGANFQAGQFVFGVEGDADWTDIKGNTPASVLGCGTACQTSNEWLATVRGRIGFAVDRVLIFGTAGGAFGDVKATAFTGSTDNTEFGWTAGGGVEFALTENWTARIDYLFIDLENSSCSTGCTPSASTVKFDTSVVRGGLNFKFGGL
jgi:outer membrane immunogenic protein